MIRGVLTLLPVAAAAFLGFTPVQAQSDDATGGVPRPLKAAALHSVTLPRDGTLYQTSNPIADQRLVAVPGSQAVVAIWSEADDHGVMSPHYAFSLDGERLSGRARETSYLIQLKYAQFDPLLGVPPVEQGLRAGAGNQIYLVQCIAPALPPLQDAVRAAGAAILRQLPDHTMVVRMDAGARARVEALPFVRWVGENHLAYKLDPSIVTDLRVGSIDADVHIRYSIECFERGAQAQQAVAARVNALGGTVEIMTPDQFRMEASLTAAQLLQIADMNEVYYIDPWGGPGGLDTNLVRSLGGANFLETTLGMTGQGVRAEVFDSEIRYNNPAAGNTHQEFAAFTPLLHSADAGNYLNAHGTSVFGICFSQGVSANARGVLPGAEARIFFDYTESSQFGGGTSRLTLDQQLVNPAGPYRAVFQTSSIGSDLTTSYTTISAEVDDYLFHTDLLSCQSQSNAASRASRPQAWAKNIVSVGAVNHYNTAGRTDDSWLVLPAGGSCGIAQGSGSSIGPAADGRVKPDLIFFYDCTYNATNSSNTAYTEFGGTSGATPSVAAQFGLFFQMWHEGVWRGRGGKSTVFDSRPHMMTAKAALCDTAYRYTWTAGGNNASIARAVQGWGMPDLQNLYNLRDRTFIVDEEDAVSPLGVKTYNILVGPGEPVLSATMCYKDPQGSTSANPARVNDLSLRVTSPGGVVYWGNNGLNAGNTSSSGGASNTVDTTENVFVANPGAGVWKVEVLGDVITTDTHLQTAAVDADFGLWVTGGTDFGNNDGPFAYTVQSNGNQHLYRVNLGTGEAADLGLLNFSDAEGISFGPDGDLYAIGGSVMELWDISVAPGSLIGNTGARNGIDAGLDYFNGVMYNLNGRTTGSFLYRINTTTGAATLVGSSTLYADSLAIDGLGNAYAASGLSGSNNLYSVNLSTGAMALIGSLGSGVNVGTGLSFAPDGTLWMVTSGGDVYTVNTTTGAATFRANVTIAGALAAGFEGLAIDKLSALAKMAIPAWDSTYSGAYTRGMWFTAPYNGSIQGLRVPDESGAGVQNVEVVRLTAGAPPTYPTTTESFVSLGRFVNVAGTGIIPCNIPVGAGDIIGVLGACGTTTMRNSYSAPAAGFASTVKGLPVTLRRLGMQYNLNTDAARSLWTDTGSLGRVELYYQDGRSNLYLDADQVASGSNLIAAPLPSMVGTTAYAGEFFPASTDPEMYAAGARGNSFDGAGLSPPVADLVFNFDVDSATFIYGGGTGQLTVQAINGAGAVVDTFVQDSTASGLPVGPRTLAGTGIRRLHWTDTIGIDNATLDNIRIHATYDCYANCDHSTTPPVLNVLDFSCFLNRFAAGDGYANCDGSTTPPVLNVLDFSCYLNRFAAGCN